MDIVERMRPDFAHRALHVMLCRSCAEHFLGWRGCKVCRPCYEIGGERDWMYADDDGRDSNKKCVVEYVVESKSVVD